MSAPSIQRVTRCIRQTGCLVLLGSLAGAAVLPAQQVTPSVIAPPLASTAAPLAIQGVTVIDVRTGQHIPSQTVVIVGRQIRTITAGSARLPRGARVVDGRGKFLIPGLWDLHVHPMRYVDIAYPLYIANGVIGVRDAGSNASLVTLNQWKQEIVAGTRVGPRLLVSGPSISQAPDTQTTVTHHPLGPQNILVPPALIRHVVDSLRAAGADMIKTYNMSREMALAVAAEARRLGVPFGGHSPSVSGLELSDSGAMFLDHEPWLSPNVCSDSAETASNTAVDDCRAAAEHLRRNNTWIPALFLTNSSSPELASLLLNEWQVLMAHFWPASLIWPANGPPRDSLRRQSVPLWNPEIDAALRRITPRPHPWYRAGMPIVLGPDAVIEATPLSFRMGPGFSAHLGLAQMVLIGMTPTEALQAATLNPARALRATDSLGTVEAGKAADLVLLDADPLQAIWNTTKIRAVIADGRYYDRASLDRLLVEAEQAAATSRADTAKSSP